MNTPTSLLEDGLFRSTNKEPDLSSIMTQIQSKKTSDEIIFYDSNEYIFSLKSHPEADQVCRINNLSHLIVPRTKLILGEGFVALAERKINITHSDLQQEYIYHENSKALDTAISQLATFICKSEENSSS